MSDAEFETYLNLLTRFLRLSAAQRAEIRRELRAHLEEALDEARRTGRDRDQVLYEILDDFGDAAELAARFSTIDRKRRWIMRGTVAAACAMIVMFGYLSLTPQVATRANADESAATEAENETMVALAVEEQNDVLADQMWRRLQERMPSIELADVSFEETIEFLRARFELNVHVHWRDLEQHGIDRNTLIRVHLSNITGEQLLRLILDSVGDDVRVSFDIHEGILVIATRDRLERHRTTEVYDLAGLLQLVRTGRTDTRAGRHDAADAPRDGLGVRGGGPPAGMNGSPAGNPWTGEKRASRQELLDELTVEQLREIIMQVVSSDSWCEMGGVGRLEVFENVLVVQQTPEVHRQLRELLEKLHDTLAARQRAAQGGMIQPGF